MHYTPTSSPAFQHFRQGLSGSGISPAFDQFQAGLGVPGAPRSPAFQRFRRGLSGPTSPAFQRFRRGLHGIPLGGTCGQWSRDTGARNAQLAAQLGWSVIPNNPGQFTGAGDCRLASFVSDWQQAEGGEVDGKIGEGTMALFRRAIANRTPVGQAIELTLRLPASSGSGGGGGSNTGGGGGSGGGTPYYPAPPAPPPYHAPPAPVPDDDGPPPGPVHHGRPPVHRPPSSSSSGGDSTTTMLMVGAGLLGVLAFLKMKKKSAAAGVPA